MNTTPRFARTALALAISATLALGSVSWSAAHAAAVQWTGQGLSASWSDAVNWSPLGAPADGDELVFGSAPGRTSSVFDLVRSFSAMTFTGDSALFVTQVSGNGAQLAFSGLGIRAFDTPETGIGRQSFFANAGSTGGTILFTLNSGVNVESGPYQRPVDITARGGSAVGAIGGHIVFQDSSSTGADALRNGDSLRAEGASAVGASGGEIIFRDNARLTRIAGALVGGGTAANAAGGRASFQDQVQVAGGVSALAGASGGLGGRVDVSGNAVFLGTSTVYAEGGTSALADAEAVVSFRGDAVFKGSAYVRSGSVAGANGGRLEFFDRASYDGTSTGSSSSGARVYNVGAVASGAVGGALIFHDDAAIVGSQLSIYNQTAEFLNPGAAAGSTSFLDRSRAGQVTIENAGAGGSGAAGAATYFRNLSTAESATVVSLGGVFNGAGGGSTQFSDNATAGAARLTNGGGSAAGALGGSTDFQGAGRAGTATIVNAPGEVVGAAGGVTTFSGNAGAGNAFISNDTSFSVAGGGGGRTTFKGSSSAQQASIDNQGGLAVPAALTWFEDDASAGNARITNFGGKAAAVYGGFTIFTDRSSAGTASIVTAGGGVDRSLGGVVEFFGDSTAGSARIDLRAATVPGAGGALAFFIERSNAGNATFTVQGAQVNTLRGPESASVTFEGVSFASSASFTVGGNVFAGGGVGRVAFTEGSTASSARFDLLAGQDRGGELSFEGADALNIASAGNATITNRGSLLGVPNFSVGGITNFRAHTTAATARITNEAGVAFGITDFLSNSSAGSATIVNAGGLAGDSGGHTFFSNDATASRALIDNLAGARIAGGFDLAGSTSFGGRASAGEAIITARGASTSADIGGLISFHDTATAANSTLVAEGGTGGGGGGRIVFGNTSSGGGARVMLNAGSSPATGGTLDISSVGVWLTVGSIEGGGQVRQGTKSLIVGSNGRATTFSGVISGDAPAALPSLTVQGGSLTLTGANLYAGRTGIGDGVNANSGKLVVANTTGSATGSGAVRIERGGTLAGSGFIAGPVTLLAGGTLAPGDPVTLTLQSSLTWDGGGLIRLVLGADDAGSDHIVGQSLVRGASGAFVFDLIDAGIVAGATYNLLQFDTVVGFVANDFTFAGSSAAGSFSIVNGAIGFTAAAVPEPRSVALLVIGLLSIGCRARRLSGATGA